MALHHEQTNLARIVEKIEQELARLYQVYSDIFPKYKDFWSGLVMAQIDHINIIHGLMNKIRGGSIQCSEAKVDCKAMESFQAEIKQEIIRAMQRKVTAIESLTTALKIEKNLSKREYLEALDENSEEVRTVFSYLAVNSQKRISWIDEHLKKAERNI